MVANFYIPRLSNDFNIDVHKNNLVANFVHQFGPSQKTGSNFNKPQITFQRACPKNGLKYLLHSKTGLKYEYLKNAIFFGQIRKFPNFPKNPLFFNLFHFKLFL